MKRFLARTISIFSSRSLSINPFPRAESSCYGLHVSHFSSSSNHHFQSWSSSAAFLRHEEESRNVRAESSCYGLHVSHFSSSSNHHFQSSSSSAASRSHEEEKGESKNVSVSVWWDIENCPSSEENLFKILKNITAAIKASGIKGPITMFSFCNRAHLSKTNEDFLLSQGIKVTITEDEGGKNNADRSLLLELIKWNFQNPPPAHVFLISGDRDFAYVLHKLRMMNYNILLASRRNCSILLRSAASIVWDWDSLIKDDNFTGKYMKQPPIDSWYGSYKIPSEDHDQQR